MLLMVSPQKHQGLPPPSPYSKVKMRFWGKGGEISCRSLQRLVLPYVENTCTMRAAPLTKKICMPEEVVLNVSSLNCNKSMGENKPLKLSLEIYYICEKKTHITQL